jgi:cell division protein FtsL
MTGLEEAFYIIAIIFMGVVFILIIALVTAVFVIKAKINKIHDTIEEKVNSLTNLAEAGGKISAAAAIVAKKAKKAVKK